MSMDASVRRKIGRLGEKPSQCLHCDVRRIGLCKAMQTTDAVSALEGSHLPPRVLRAGARVYAQGEEADAVYNVISGWVGLRGSPGLVDRS